MEGSDIRYMGTNVRVFSSDTQPTFAERYQIAKGFPVKSYISRDDFAPTCCLFVKKDVFDEVGMFNKKVISTGDLEFGNRVHNHGIELYYEPDITVYHPARSSLADLWKKQIRVGTGKAQLYKDQPEVIDQILHPRHFLPTTPMHFYDQLDTEYDAEYWELIIFYFLNYILKLRRFVAMISTWYQQEVIE